MNPMVLSALRHAALVECLTQRSLPIAQGNHFVLYHLQPTNTSIGVSEQTIAHVGDIIVVHHFAPHHIDNNIGYYVANELLPLIATAVHDYACYAEQEIFERYVGAIVRSIDGDERAAWQLFYTNTLQRLSHNAAPHNGTHPVKPYDFIENFGAIYQHICQLIDAPDTIESTGQGYTLLDVATCFGFLSFFLANATSRPARNARRIVGCDLNPALVNLARDYARQQQLNHIEFVEADILADDITALRSRLQATTFDVVTAIHLLEHLEAAQMPRVLSNLWQLTGRRLIIAVPLEEVPDARFGHVQTFNRDKLLALGQHIAGTCHYHEYHGGWLVMDRQVDCQDVPDQPSERLPILECLNQ